MRSIEEVAVRIVSRITFQPVLLVVIKALPMDINMGTNKTTITTTPHLATTDLITEETKVILVAAIKDVVKMITMTMETETLDRPDRTPIQDLVISDTTLGTPITRSSNNITNHNKTKVRITIVTKRTTIISSSHNNNKEPNTNFNRINNNHIRKRVNTEMITRVARDTREMIGHTIINRILVDMTKHLAAVGIKEAGITTTLGVIIASNNPV